MGTHDESAVAIHQTTSQEGVGTIGIDLRKQQGRTPTQQGVTRGIAAVLAQCRLILRIECGLIEAHEGALAHVVTLRDGANAVASGCSLAQYLINLWSLFLRNLESKGLAELTDDAVESINGIADGDIGTLLTVAHLLAPKITHNIIGKTRIERVRRSRTPL